MLFKNLYIALKYIVMFVDGSNRLNFSNQFITGMWLKSEGSFDFNFPFQDNKEKEKEEKEVNKTNKDKESRLKNKLILGL